MVIGHLYKGLYILYKGDGVYSFFETARRWMQLQSMEAVESALQNKQLMAYITIHDLEEITI